MNDQPEQTRAEKLRAYGLWAVVSAALVYGIVETFIKASALFS